MGTPKNRGKKQKGELILGKKWGGFLFEGTCFEVGLKGHSRENPTMWGPGRGGGD